jgi:energy-converting hydrogenase Eha subunit G
MLGFEVGMANSDLRELVDQMPSFLKKNQGLIDKYNITILIVHLFLLTAPLMISVALIVYAALEKALTLFSAGWCLIIPFGIYFFLINPHAIENVDLVGPDDWKAVRDLKGPSAALGVIFFIVSFYLKLYKIGALGAVLFGGYAGFKIHELENK